MCVLLAIPFLADMSETALVLVPGSQAQRFVVVLEVREGVELREGLGKLDSFVVLHALFQPIQL